MKQPLRRVADRDACKAARIISLGFGKTGARWGPVFPAFRRVLVLLLQFAAVFDIITRVRRWQK